MTEYLHDKGTDKLIAAVREFDPTRVNVGEQDEVPEMFDEMTGPCDGGPAVTPACVPADAISMTFANGVAAGVNMVLVKLYINHNIPLAEIEAVRQAVHADVFKTYGKEMRPAAPTRQG